MSQVVSRIDEVKGVDQVVDVTAESEIAIKPVEEDKSPRIEKNEEVEPRGIRFSVGKTVNQFTV